MFPSKKVRLDRRNSRQAVPGEGQSCLVVPSTSSHRLSPNIVLAFGIILAGILWQQP